MSEAERLEAAIAEGREFLAEVRGAMRDLRGVIRDAEDARKRLAACVHEQVDQDVGALVKRQLDNEIGPTITACVERIDAAMFRRFDELANTMMHGNKQGRGPSLAEQVRKLVADRGLPTERSE